MAWKFPNEANGASCASWTCIASGLFDPKTVLLCRLYWRSSPVDKLTRDIYPRRHGGHVSEHWPFRSRLCSMQLMITYSQHWIVLYWTKSTLSMLHFISSVSQKTQQHIEIQMISTPTTTQYDQCFLVELDRAFCHNSVRKLWNGVDLWGYCYHPKFNHPEQRSDCNRKIHLIGFCSCRRRAVSPTRHPDIAHSLTSNWSTGSQCVPCWNLHYVGTGLLMST